MNDFEKLNNSITRGDLNQSFSSIYNILDDETGNDSYGPSYTLNDNHYIVNGSYPSGYSRDIPLKIDQDGVITIIGRNTGDALPKVIRGSEEILPSGLTSSNGLIVGFYAIDHDGVIMETSVEIEGEGTIGPFSVMFESLGGPTISLDDFHSGSSSSVVSRLLTSSEDSAGPMVHAAGWVGITKGPLSVKPSADHVIKNAGRAMAGTNVPLNIQEDNYHGLSWSFVDGTWVKENDGLGILNSVLSEPVMGDLGLWMIVDSPNPKTTIRIWYHRTDGSFISGMSHTGEGRYIFMDAVSTSSYPFSKIEIRVSDGACEISDIESFSNVEAITFAMGHSNGPVAIGDTVQYSSPTSNINIIASASVNP